MYEVDYADGYKAAMTANNIASNPFVQVDQDGNRFVLFDEIIDHRENGSEIKPLMETSQRLTKNSVLSNLTAM